MVRPRIGKSRCARGLQSGMATAILLSGLVGCQIPIVVWGPPLTDETKGRPVTFAPILSSNSSNRPAVTMSPSSQVRAARADSIEENTLLAPPLSQEKLVQIVLRFN